MYYPFVGINRAVIAVRSLRDAIGSEWKPIDPGSNVVRIESVNTNDCTVRLSDGTWVPAMTFLKVFKAAIPKDKIPTWYARLLEDKLI